MDWAQVAVWNHGLGASRCIESWTGRKSLYGPEATKRAIIGVNSIVSEWNYDTLTSIIAQLLTSRPFGDLSHGLHDKLPVADDIEKRLR